MVNKLFGIESDSKSGRTVVRLFGLKIILINKKNIVKPTYAEVVSRIRNKYQNNEKIKVGFLVNQTAKWNAEKLYNLFDKHDAFDCSNCGAMAGRKCIYCPGCGAKMKNGTRAMEGR